MVVGTPLVHRDVVCLGGGPVGGWCLKEVGSGEEGVWVDVLGGGRGKMGFTRNWKRKGGC